jgi:uncharacterized membrane protein
MIVFGVIGLTGGMRVALAGTLTPLGMPTGWSSTLGTAVSADGSVVVGYGSNGSGKVEGFRWTQDGCVGMGLPSSSWNAMRPYGISSDGSVVGGTGWRYSTDQAYAFRWTESSGFQTLSRPSIMQDTYFGDISADGSMIIGDGNGISYSVQNGFRWPDSGGYHVVYNDDWNNCYPTAVSADGTVIAGYSVDPMDRAFIWTSDDGFQSVGRPTGGSLISVRDMTPDGSIIAADDYSHVNGLGVSIWSQGTGWQVLGKPDDFTKTMVKAISPDGAMIGGFGKVGSVTTAYVWTDNGGMQPLDAFMTDAGIDYTGWSHFTAIYGISSDGDLVQMTGYGTRNGATEAFLVTVPDPVTLNLLGLGGLALILRRNRPVVRGSRCRGSARR